MDLAGIPRAEGREAIASQLDSLGLTVLASVVDAEDDTHYTYYAATEAGIFRAEATHSVASIDVQSELTPWTNVTGASMAMAGFQDSDGPWLLTVHVATPPIEVQARMTGIGKDVQRFAEVCMKRQLGWAHPQDQRA